MKYIGNFLFLLSLLALGQSAMAQPPARKRAAAIEQANVSAVPLSERAKNQYPTTTLPSEVVWKRDIYRVLDLTKEKNAPLYYPVEPMGEEVNLFTCLFRLLLNDQIKAYTYNLDGYESFASENRLSVKDMLDNFHIYYEEKEGKPVVSPSDIPSNEVLSYYIKESNLFDQQTSTFHQRVVAICPVLHRTGDFTTEVTKYPMFWLNFDEIAPFLGQHTVMASSYNNVSNTTMNDFFVKNQYAGEIYKTVNPRNLSLSQYCADDVAVKKEQENIERQLTDFRKNLWGNTPRAAQGDTLATNEVANTKERAKKVDEPKEKTVKSSAQGASQKKEKSSSSKSSGSPRISVRRSRR